MSDDLREGLHQMHGRATLDEGLYRAAGTGRLAYVTWPPGCSSPYAHTSDAARRLGPREERAVAQVLARETLDVIERRLIERAKAGAFDESCGGEGPIGYAVALIEDARGRANTNA